MKKFLSKNIFDRVEKKVELTKQTKKNTCSYGCMIEKGFYTGETQLNNLKIKEELKLDVIRSSKGVNTQTTKTIYIEDKSGRVVYKAEEYNQSSGGYSLHAKGVEEHIPHELKLGLWLVDTYRYPQD